MKRLIFIPMTFFMSSCQSMFLKQLADAQGNISKAKYFYDNPDKRTPKSLYAADCRPWRLRGQNSEPVYMVGKVTGKVTETKSPYAIVGRYVCLPLDDNSPLPPTGSILLVDGILVQSGTNPDLRGCRFRPIESISVSDRLRGPIDRILSGKEQEIRLEAGSKNTINY